MLANFFSGFAATIVTVPIIGIIALNIILRIFVKNKRKAFHITTELSAILLIFSVNALTQVIWGKSFLWIILILLLVIAIGITFIQWRKFQDIYFVKFLKMFLRFNFVIFFVGYICFVIIGITKKMLMYI